MTALTHEQTPELVCVDSRGQRLRQVAYHRTSAQQAPERRVELSRVDLSGQSRRQWDPRRLQRESLSPSQLVLSTLSGRVVLDESQDAGWQLVLPGESGPASEAWDARGSH